MIFIIVKKIKCIIATGDDSILTFNSDGWAYKDSWQYLVASEVCQTNNYRLYE